MKRKLAKLFQWLADKCDRFSSGDRGRCEKRVRELFYENVSLHDRLASLEVVIPKVSIVWTPEAAVKLAAFLETETGKALSNHMRMFCAANAIDGARKSAETNTIAPACIAAGWDEAVRYLHSLSRVPRVPDTTQNDKAPPGETELLEQLSP